MSTRGVMGVQHGDGWHGMYRHSDSYPSAAVADLYRAHEANGLGALHAYLAATSLEEARAVLAKAPDVGALTDLHSQMGYCEEGEAWDVWSHDDPDPLSIEWVYALDEGGRVAVFEHEQCPHGRYIGRVLGMTRVLDDGSTVVEQFDAPAWVGCGDGQIHGRHEPNGGFDRPHRLECGCTCYGHCAYRHRLVSTFCFDQRVEDVVASLNALSDS